MEFFETVNTRCSIREYSEREVAPQDLEQILHAANRAPSAGNLQAFEVITVRSAEKRQALAEASFGQMWMAKAPVILAFFSNAARNREKYGAFGESVLAMQDATIACAYAELAVKALGLGACWVAVGKEELVQQITGAPAEWRPIALLTVGHPAENPDPRERRALAELQREAP